MRVTAEEVSCPGITVSPRVCKLESNLTSAMEELAVTKDAVTHTKEQLQKLVVERDEMVH